MRSLLFSMLVPLLCSAQTAVPGVPAPVIAVDQPHFDFGKLYTETKAVHRFKVANKGNAPLNITKLNASCGCTSTVIGQWTLNPGQSTEIEATFNPTGFRGLIHKSIQVVSNDPATPNLNLTFEAEVLREIMPSPESIFLQEVIRSVPQKRSVKFTSASGPVHLTEAKAAGAPYLTAAIRPEGKEAWVDVVLDGRLVPAGRTVGTDVIVVRTDNPKVPLINLTVQWEMRATISVDPVRVAWVEPAGKDLRSKVTLKQVDGKPFRILSAKTTNPSILKVEGLGKGAAAQHELQVVLAASAKAGSYNEKILFTTDSPDQPELELRVAAVLK
jgi:hypothetical protein